jgi:hypothetical protein
MLIASKSSRHLTHILFAFFTLFFCSKSLAAFIKSFGGPFSTLGKKIGPKIGCKLRFFAQ